MVWYHRGTLLQLTLPVCYKTCSADPLCTDGLGWRRRLKLSLDTVRWVVYLVFPRHTVKVNLEARVRCRLEEHSEAVTSISIRSPLSGRVDGSPVFFCFFRNGQKCCQPEAQSLIVVVWPTGRAVTKGVKHSDDVEASCITCRCGRRVSIFYPASLQRRVALPFQPHTGTAICRGPSLATSSQSLTETHVGTVDKCTSHGVQYSIATRTVVLFFRPSHHCEGREFLEYEIRRE